jgi:hypothetical protein
MPSCQKLSLGLLATITLEVVPFHPYAPFHVLLLFLNAYWKLSSVRVFSIACDSAWITSVVSKWRPFSFIVNQENRKVGWMGEDSLVIFGQKVTGEKGRVRRCIVMMQQRVLCRQSFERSLRTFSSNCLETSQ